jgi:ribosomal protein S18 acetylase RimI-like enzyme
MRERANARKPSRRALASALVRAPRAEDLEAIIALDARVTGEAKSEFWRRKLGVGSTFLMGDQPLARVAEVGGRIVGVVIGEIRSWEFHLPPTGWITVLMVDPDYRRQGIGRRLLAEALDYFRERGVRSVRTMVGWSDGDVLSFFTAMGFDRGPFIELEKAL